MGHGRGAVYGDANIGRILEIGLGHEVSREYYVNDAGRQIDILACSIFLRKFECFDEDQFPGSAYKGSYILEIADAIEINIGITETEKESLIKDLPDENEEIIDALIKRIKINYSDTWSIIRDFGLILLSDL